MAGLSRGLVGFPKGSSDPLLGSAAGLLIYFCVILILAVVTYVPASLFIRLRIGNLFGRSIIFILAFYLGARLTALGISELKIESPAQVGFAGFFHNLTGAENEYSRKAPPGEEVETPDEPQIASGVEIAILPFENVQDPEEDLLGSVLADQISIHLSSGENVQCLASYEVDEAFESFRLKGKTFKEGQLRKMGKYLSVDAVVSGIYKRTQNKIEGRVKLVFTERSEDSKTWPFEGPLSEGKLDALCRAISKRLLDRIQFTLEYAKSEE